MKFGNPVSSVSISGGTVAITSAGTLTTSGVVTSTPSTSVPATATATATLPTGPATTNLVPATVGVQVLLLSIIVQLQEANPPGTCTFSLQSTGGTHILDLQAQGTAAQPLLLVIQGLQYDLQELLLASGLGVQVVTTGAALSVSCVVSLFYTTVAAGGSFAGHTVHT